MMTFTMILLAWAALGFVGLLNCKKPRIMWELIAFAGFVPFVPFIAKFFGVI